MNFFKYNSYILLVLCFFVNTNVFCKQENNPIKNVWPKINNDKTPKVQITAGASFIGTALVSYIISKKLNHVSHKMFNEGVDKSNIAVGGGEMILSFLPSIGSVMFGTAAFCSGVTGAYLIYRGVTNVKTNIDKTSDINS